MHSSEQELALTIFLYRYEETKKIVSPLGGRSWWFPCVLVFLSSLPTLSHISHNIGEVLLLHTPSVVNNLAFTALQLHILAQIVNRGL